jgi:hypothetical protein
VVIVGFGTAGRIALTAVRNARAQGIKVGLFRPVTVSPFPYDRVAELADKAKQMGGDLDKAAKAMGLEVKTSAEFQESGNVEGLGAGTYFHDGFQSPDGTILKPIGLPDGTVVVKVVQHIPADMSKFAEQRASVRDEIKARRARDRGEVFDDGVREDLTRRGKIKIHKQVMDRMLASYRAS